MRTLNRQSKDHRHALIPQDLAAFLAKVDLLVLSRDPLATTVSDDLLQDECAYGGLLEEGRDTYFFTYFPEEGVRHKWCFNLTGTEISAIAKGNRNTLELWFCRSADCRSGFQNPTDSCLYCDYED